MAIENFQCASHSIIFSVYYRAHHGWPGKFFKTVVPRQLENAILDLAFANKRFQFHLFQTNKLKLKIQSTC